MYNNFSLFIDMIKDTDPEIADQITNELNRQQDHLE